MNEARTIERLPVDSSNLKSVGYDEPRAILAVEFQGGSIFHYYNVPLSVFEELGQAESRGHFYAKRIRGTFVGKPMTGKCASCGAQGLIGEVCQAPLMFAGKALEGELCEGAVREIDRQHKD